MVEVVAAELGHWRRCGSGGMLVVLLVAFLFSLPPRESWRVPCGQLDLLTRWLV
jgi:hypothetical protein